MRKWAYCAYTRVNILLGGIKMELKELYAKKGELVTQFEMLQANANVIGEELKKINQSIGQEIQKAQTIKKEEPKVEEKKK